MSSQTMYAKWTKPFTDLNKLQEHDKQSERRYQVNPKESHLMIVNRIFRKSTSGACQLLGGKLVCWSAKKQQSVAMSSAEAKYVPIFCDNTSAYYYISNKPLLHSRTTHIDINITFIKDHILKGDIELHFIPTQYQLADIFTKPLDEPTFKRLIVELEPFTKSPNMYKEYLAEFWYFGKALENNAIGAHYLPHSSEYVAPPSIDILRPWFETIGYGETVPVKGTLKKSLIPPKWRLLMAQMKEGYGDGELALYPTQVFSINNWALKPNQPEEPLFTNHMLAICSATELVVFKAPKPSFNAERVPQGTKPGAKPGHKKHSTSSKQPFVSIKEATEDTGMHKDDQQATGGPTSLGVTSEARANPWLSSGVSTFNLNKPIYSAIFHYSLRVEEEEASSTIKLEDLEKLVSNMQPSFKDLDSPGDDHVIVVDDSDKDEEDEVHTTTNAETEDTSVPNPHLPAKAKAALLKAQPSFPNVRQLNELLVKSLQTEFSKILSAHDFSSSLLTELKDLPSKFNELTKEVKGLKKQVYELEIKLPGELKGNPTKLEDFTKTVTSLTSQVAELKTLQWELPAEFLSLPVQVASVQAKLKTLDALPRSLVKCQADTMPAEGEKNTNQATISQLFQRRAEKNADKENLNNEQPKLIPPIITTTTQIQSPPLQSPPKSSSQPEGEHIKKDKGKKAMSSEEAEKDKEINHQKKLEEDAKAEAAKQEGEIRKAKLVDQLGPEVVNMYYNDKLQEVVAAYPNKKGKGWTSIYKQIQERMDYLRTTEAELRINLDRPLSEQLPLDRLHDLANKKRKHTDDIHDFFRANKRLKSSVQYKDHPAGLCLMNLSPSMILFNLYHKQDFVTIEDFKDFPNIMLYTIQEIFFKLHQGPRLDDHARTFSSLLLAEIDKRNLNPLKQMRVIEQLRQ
ncbi:hypothetical protein Tco_0516604 [Tanacetum coccineum]